MVLDEVFIKNIEDVQAIKALPTILDVLSQSTGMGFIAVARVTQEKWITCAVQDNVAFGLTPGDELEVESTICHEVRQAEKLVVIDHVEKDTFYNVHPTPLRYGFQSYISVPIIRKNGDFFGTLCAIDPNPNKLNNPKVIGMFTLYSELISFHLEAIENLHLKTQEIKKKDIQLEAFGFVSSHDLQEPLRKIQTFSNIIREKEAHSLTPSLNEYFTGIEKEAKKMRNILKDLLDYSEIEEFVDRFETIDLSMVIEGAIAQLKNELTENEGNISIGKMCEIKAIPIQLQQLFFCLIANSIAFKSASRPLSIKIECSIKKGVEFDTTELEDNLRYCEITVADNGIGFDQKYNEKIFGMFKRLGNSENNRSTGIGLAIAKRIADNHRGKILAFGAVEKGATFKVYLPLEELN